MAWQEQQREAYEQQQAEKQQAKEQEAARMRLQLRQQFTGKQQREQDQRTAAAQKAAEAKLREQEEQQQTNERLAASLKRESEEKTVRYHDAIEHIQQERTQSTHTWRSKDGRTFRSPYERDFWDAWQEAQTGIMLFPQYRIGTYYVDFAHQESLTAIEIDGYAYHGQHRGDFHKDKERHQRIEEQGWRLTRFSSEQIVNDIDRTIARIVLLIQRNWKSG